MTFRIEKAIHIILTESNFDNLSLILPRLSRFELIFINLFGRKLSFQILEVPCYDSEKALLEDTRSIFARVLKNPESANFADRFQFLFESFVNFLRKKLETAEVIKNSKNNHYLYKYYFLSVSKVRQLSLDAFKNPLVKRKSRQKIKKRK